MTSKHDEWQRNNTARYSIRVSNKTGIPDAMEIIKQSGIKPGTYLRKALIKQLRADGYSIDYEDDEDAD